MIFHLITVLGIEEKIFIAQKLLKLFHLPMIQIYQLNDDDGGCFFLGQFLKDLM